MECVFCVVSTPGENKHTLAPPGGTGETPSGPGIRHERAAPDTAYNTSGTMTMDMIIKYSCSVQRYHSFSSDKAKIRFRT